jgi:hypothetical protein
MRIPNLLLIAAVISCDPTNDPLTDCAKQCDPSGPQSMACVDSDLPDTARQGVRMWASVLCDRTFAIQVIDGLAPIPADCDYAILVAMSYWDWVQTDAVAFAEPSRGIAWIVLDRCPQELVRAATAHELGALLGATDDLGPGVMSGNLTDACIATRSVDEVTR